MNGKGDGDGSAGNREGEDGDCCKGEKSIIEIRRDKAEVNVVGRS